MPLTARLNANCAGLIACRLKVHARLPLSVLEPEDRRIRRFPVDSTFGSSVTGNKAPAAQAVRFDELTALRVQELRENEHFWAPVYPSCEFERE